MGNLTYVSGQKPLLQQTCTEIENIKMWWKKVYGLFIIFSIKHK
jgi:hypothetical protein